MYISFTLEIPPPTVRGINTFEAVFSTTSIIVFRPSCVAVISKNTISSAPASLYKAAISTGSPTSCSPIKFTPFTTRPSFTSRHGIMRFANITLLPLALLLNQSFSRKEPYQL